MLGLSALETSDRGFQIPSGGHYRVLQENTFSPLLVRSGFQRGQKMLRLRVKEEEIA
jgi:hypothetical protein